ncbi:seminal vesicle secretory protein 2-like [Mastomys coucha]|uniref:seminal vesicle secretory protein 2-like n=1 Tax=Mastomys coucha TaxID=35658 RepID=UPI00126151E8|nr:seminal vesicle secretory protein 2-like [Mastomys coucha]
MKSSVFILSLLLILERQAAVVGQYGATKGHFQSSSSEGFMLGQKGHLSFGIKGGSEEAAEESVFMQSQHQVYGQDGGDMTQTRVSQGHASVKGAALCRNGQVSQLKSQESQIKSFGQVKSSGQLKSGGSSFGQVKSSVSQTKSFGQVKSSGQLKSGGSSFGQVKSSVSQTKSFGQVKSSGQLKSGGSSFGQLTSSVSQTKSFGQAKSQGGQMKSYGQLKTSGKSYGEEAQLKSFGQLKAQDAQLKSYGKQNSQQQSSFSQVKSQSSQLKSSYGQQKSLKGFSQQSQHKGFAMGEGMSQVRKQFSDDGLSVQQKSTQQMKAEEDFSQFGQQRQFGQERSQSYKGYLDQYRKKLQGQQQKSFNQDSYFTKGGAGLYQAQLKG